MGGRGVTSSIGSSISVSSGDREIDSITRDLINSSELKKSTFSDRSLKRVGLMQNAKKDIADMSKTKDGLFSKALYNSKVSAKKLKSLKNELKNLDKETKRNQKQAQEWAEKASKWSKSDPTREVRQKWGVETVYSKRSEDAFFKASQLNNLVSKSEAKKANLKREISNFYSDYKKRATLEVERAYRLKNLKKKK